MTSATLPSRTAVSLNLASICAFSMFIAATAPLVRAADPVSDVTAVVSQEALLTLKGEGTGRLPDADARTGTPAPAGPAIPVPAKLPATVAASSTEPRLKPGLVIDIVVAAGGRKEVTETAKRVTDDGDIGLPLVGTVHVEGMTLKDLAEHLRTQYSSFLRSPEVNIDFNLSNPGSPSPWGLVTVLGTVKNPGSVNIPQTQDLTVSRAIRAVGGFDTSADDSAIVVSRRKPDGTIKKIRVNLHGLGSTGQLKQDIKLEAGDVIFVPEEWL